LSNDESTVAAVGWIDALSARRVARAPFLVGLAHPVIAADERAHCTRWGCAAGAASLVIFLVWTKQNHFLCWQILPSAQTEIEGVKSKCDAAMYDGSAKTMKDTRVHKQLACK